MDQWVKISVLSRKKGKPPMGQHPPQENLCYPCPSPMGQLMNSVLPQTNSLHHNMQSEGKALPFSCMRGGMCGQRGALMLGKGAIQTPDHSGTPQFVRAGQCRGSWEEAKSGASRERGAWRSSSPARRWLWHVCVPRVTQ